MRRRFLHVLPALAIVIALLSTAAPAMAGTATAVNCHGFADIPRPADLHSTLPRLYAWGEFHCDARASVAVQVCAIRFTPTGQIRDDKVLWCRRAIVEVPPGGRSFVRTPLHACTPGKLYVSYIRILGQGWDRGPWTRCRSL